MNIPVKVWIKYRDTLARINRKAYDDMTAFLDRIGGYGGHEEEVIDFAYALATKYGEAAGALACEMYDAVARASGVNVPPAVPAETATYEETAKAVRGTAKNSEIRIPQTVSRLSKQAGADTTLQNAARDKAQFAWIPSGDTCAFCRMLASRGWQNQSKKTLRNGHAEHIHANCDCEYAISFKGGAEYASFYDPEQYLSEYYEAMDRSESGDWKGALNEMRRELYAKNKDMINAQKRAAYARRNTQLLSSNIVNLKDEIVGKSVSAKFENYDIMDLATGEIFHLAEGSRLQNKEVFAGKGSKTPYRNAEKYAERYGGKAEDWQHVKAIGTLETDEGDQLAEIHWSQCEGVGKREMFVKKWLE